MKKILLFIICMLFYTICFCDILYWQIDNSNEDIYTFANNITNTNENVIMNLKKYYQLEDGTNIYSRPVVPEDYTEAQKIILTEILYSEDISYITPKEIETREYYILY